MKGRFRDSSIVYRFLISFVAVLIVPLLLLGVSGYHQLVKIVNGQIETHHQEILSQLMDSVDSKLVDMNIIAGRIAANPELTPYAINNYFYSTYSANPLSDYMLSKNYLHELLLYMRGGEYLYSSSTTYRLQAFTDDIYLYDHWSKEQFKGDLNGSTEPQLRPEENVSVLGQGVSRFLTYLVPVPLGSSHPYGTVIFMIKGDALLSYIGNNRELQGGNTIIYDQDGRFILSYKDDADFREPGMYEKITSGQPPFKISKFDSEDFFVSYVKSPQTGWTYVQLLPVAEIIRPINAAAGKWLWTLALILLLGSLAIYAAVSYNYHPIKKLIETIETIRRSAPKKMNELEFVGTLIKQMAESNKTLERKVDQGRSAMKDYLLTELLKGEIERLEDWNEWGEEVGLPFHQARICVAVVEAGWLAAADKPALIERMEAKMAGRVRAFSKESLDEHRLIIILFTDYSEAQLHRWLKTVHKGVGAALGKPFTMGLGKLYDQLDEAGRSFIEASTAVDYRLIKGGNRPIFFDELAVEGATSEPLPRQELEMLGLFIRQGMTEKVSEAIRRIAEKITQSGVTLAAARCLCYDVILTVSNTVFEITLEYPQIRKPFPDVLALMNFHTVEELAEEMITACVALSDDVRTQKTNGSDQAIDGMIRYIREHYRNYDFSLQTMADHFSLSMSYLSRFFKEKTGSTVLEYVNQVRIDYAKELLRDPDTPIKDIVKQVGYVDASSFTRKFKTIVGLTPGEYRKM
ncbi:MAG: AraC family transcriptional regulator [Paenibacillaceae bacterium]|nr:AraC family transcriptional regulator [Paenibacillaceae bacterium]